MNRNSIVLLTIVLTVVVICVGGFFVLFQREAAFETSPPKGEAAYNRFYALERILAATGQPASGEVRLAEVLPVLTTRDTVVIGDDIALINVEESNTLVAWVQRGGHLMFSPMSYASHDVPLLEALNLFGVAKNPYACSRLSTSVAATSGDAQQAFLSLCGMGFTLQPIAAARVQQSLRDSHGNLAFARIALGAGTITALNDLAVLSYDRLQGQPAQQFASRLLQPSDGHVYLFYQLIGASFWANLFLRGWPALAASLLLAAGWLLMQSQRLGPWMPTPPPHRRALLEHIQAVGEFLFRRDGGRSLHRLACAAVLARLRRRDPAGAMLKDDELYAWLAQRSKLEPSRIADAFRSPANATAFRVCITTLARIRSHL